MQGQQHPAVLAIADRDSLWFQLPFEPGGVTVCAGGIDHHHDLRVAAVVDDQVITDTASIVEQHGVLGFPRADALQVTQPLQLVFHARATEGQYAHVGDVEHSAALTHCAVLCH